MNHSPWLADDVTDAFWDAMLVDTSFGASQADDSWTGIGASTLNQRIAEGVVAANVTAPPGDYQSRVSGMAGQLSGVCQ
jgi:hypothetical protein